MAKKKYKISMPRFLTVLAGLIVLISIIIIISARKSREQGAIELPDSTSGVLSPLPSASATPTPAVSPTATPSPTPSPTLPATPVPTLPPTSTPKPTVSPTPGLKKDPKALSKPTSSMKKNAATGVLSGNNVNLRQGPSASTPILAQNLKKNAELTVYILDKGFYFVKINSTGKYGYISKNYVKLTSDFGKKATPTPDVSKEKAPSGSSVATITASKVALRAEPDTSSKCIAEYTKGTTVYVFSRSKDFYYVQIAGSSKTGYIYSKYIKINEQ